MKAYMFVSVLLGLLVLPAPAVAQLSSDPSASWVTAGPVHAVARSGSTLFLGGDFAAIAPSTQPASVRPRSNLAAINLDTGELLPFTPNVDGVVRALAVFGDVLYVGGDFQHVDQLPRGRLAAFETVTRLLTAWNPNADGAVHALAVRAEVGSTTIYAGGDFASIGTALRGRVAAIDAASGVATSWTPPVFDGVVKALETFGHLYVGGAFATVGGASALHLVRLDLATGAYDVTWAPAPDGEVRALCVGEGFTLFAGGQFSVAGGTPHSNLVQLDLATGLASGWQPDPNGAVNAVSCFPSLMAGGEFTTIGSGAALQTRPRLAELSTSATGPSGTYATSFMTDDVGIVLDITGRPGPDGVSVGAAGEPSSGGEPTTGLAFFARDVAGTPGRPVLPSVEILAGPNGSKTVRLRWAPPPRGPRPTSYRLYAGSAPGVYNYASGLPVASTEFEAVAPVRLLIYVRVQAVNAFGAGPLSEELTFVTEDACTVPPNPPEFTTSVNGSNVTISWTASAGESAHTYRLEAGLGSGRSDFVYEFPSSQTSFSVVAPAGVYFVRLRAIGHCGLSLGSSEVPVVVAGSNAPATPPRHLGVGLDSHNSVRVSWSPPAVGVPVAYRLEAGTGFGLSNLGALTTTETPVWFLGVPPGTYYVRVYAIGAAGSTAASDEVIFVRP